VLLGVCFGGIASVLRCVQMVRVGDVCVMRGLFVSAGVVMFRRLLVMTCRVFVMLRRYRVRIGDRGRRWSRSFRMGASAVRPNCGTLRV
jgi:hypothetical protein